MLEDIRAQYSASYTIVFSRVIPVQFVGVKYVQCFLAVICSVS
jgi:hypothetical protein